MKKASNKINQTLALIQRINSAQKYNNNSLISLNKQDATINKA